jgi:hypothetical protein
MVTGSKDYDFLEIERRWQSFWERERPFRAGLDPSRPKYYVLDMFPYPSGAGLHIGHPEGYTATDIIARYKGQGLRRAAPDGLGRLRPARRAARGEDRHPPRRQHPEQYRQLQAADQGSLGFSYDWDREVDTTDPLYFKWTQWIFLQLFRMGLAYVDERPVWWCPRCAPSWRTRRSWTAGARWADSPSSARTCASGSKDHRVRRPPALGARRHVDWPDSTKRMQAAGSAGARAPRSSSRLSTRRSAGSRSSRPGPTRSLAAPTWCSPPSTRWSARSRRPSAAEPPDELTQDRRLEERPRAHRPGQGQVRRLHRRLRGEPRQRRAHPGLDVLADYVLTRPATAPAPSWPCPAHDERDHEFATGSFPGRGTGASRSPSSG